MIISCRIILYIYMQIDKNASMEFINSFKWMISITILGSKGTSSSPSMLLDSAPPFLLEKRHTQKKSEITKVLVAILVRI